MNKISFKIFICFFIPILFMIIIGTMAYQKSAEGMNGQFQESTLQTLNMATEYIEMSGKFIETEATKYAFDATLGKYYLGLLDSDQFARSEAVKTAKSNLMSAKTTNPFINNIHIVTQSDVEMISTYSTTNQLGLTAKQTGNLEEYKAQMTTDGKNLSKWVDDHSCLDEHLSLNKSDYILAYQMMSSQKSACVVIDVKPETIGEFLAGLDLGQGSIAGFVTENGREIICRDAEDGETKVWSAEEGIFYGQDFYMEVCGARNTDEAADDATDEADEAADDTTDEADEAADDTTDEAEDDEEETALSGAREVSYEGQDYLFLYSKSQINNAVICALVPIGVVMGQAETIKKLTFTLVILAVVIAGIIGSVITAGIQRNMKKISRSFGKVAEGDLTVQVKASGKDEFRGLAASASNMIDKNKKLVAKVTDATAQLEDSAKAVKTASEVISSYSEKIAVSISGINKGMEKQSSHAQICVDQTNALSDEIGDVKGIIEKVEYLVSETEEMIGQGMSMVQVLSRRAEETTEITSMVGQSIEALEQESSVIGSFVGTIADIARQTNLLSLNASIEAARAGEAGRGFGVVAEEIRKLADDSAGAAGEIKNNMENVTKQTRGSAENARKAEQMVALQTQSVSEVTTLFKDMSSHMSGLISGLKEIASSMEEADEKREETLGSVHNISDIIEDTACSTQEVNKVILRLSESVENLNKISVTLDQNMGELKTEISLFKIK